MAQVQRQLRDVLLEERLVSPEDLTAAEQEETTTGKSAWKTLLERGIVNEHDLVRARALQVGLEFIDFRLVAPNPAAVPLIPEDVARRQQLVPVDLRGDVLIVAMAEPGNHLALEEAARVSGRQVMPAAAYRPDLLAALDRTYPGGAPAAPGNGGPAAPAAIAAALTEVAPQGPAAPQGPPAGMGAPAPAPHTQAPSVGSFGAAEMSASPGVGMPMVEASGSLQGPVIEEINEGEEEREPNLAEFLMAVVDGAGSDLHLTAGLPPMIRVHGDLERLKGYRILQPQDLQQLIYSMLTQKQREKFEEALELDISYQLPGKARFRVNVFQQRDAMGSVMRIIPFEIKDLETLGLPPSVKEFTRLRRGLVLVTGITGSGKSTTLAGMIDMINDSRAEHIMTVEDPIEFLHKHKKSVINQREVGADTHGFAVALKHVLRQDPDIILVGEMRDLETISSALTAAETGHLVFGTLHTQDAPQSVDRVIDVFPPHQQQQIRIQLAGTLAGVVSQQLVPTPDGKGRVVAAEVLVVTPAVKNLIREGKTHQIYTSMQAGGKFGMQVMDQHLAELVKMGKCTYEMALERSHHIEEFNRLAGKG
ncbi:MAG TPA: PilT/PilU family type 4a pilus ATPase [Actinomycetota bacterium]|nr:PilT/PilU family type 4a pilus ATPase [Actinomycetota bacterium]